MDKYIIPRECFKNVTKHQLDEMLSGFELDSNGNIVIYYTQKEYILCFILFN